MEPQSQTRAQVGDHCVRPCVCAEISNEEVGRFTLTLLRDFPPSGVVGLTLIDLRARTGIVGRLVLVGVRGGKLAAIKDHMKSAIADRYPASEYDMSMDTFPAPEATDPSAYLEVGVPLAVKTGWTIDRVSMRLRV